MRQSRRIQQFISVAILGAVLGLLVACGGASPAAGTGQSSTPAAPAAPAAPAPQSSAAPAAAPAPAPAPAPAAPAAPPIALKVGILPILPMTPVRTAAKLGYFKDEGLAVELTTFQGGAVALPALLNGQVDITYSNYPSVVQLVQQGGKIQVIAGGTTSLTKPPDAGALMVGADSKIQSLKDLAGQTIGFNTLKSVEYISVQRMLQKAGVDPKSVKYLEVPWANQADVYKQGTIQVLSVIEPFQTRYEKLAGFKTLAYFYVEAWPQGVPLAGWAAKTDWVASHREATQRFVRALDRAVQYLRQNPAEERKLMEEFSKLAPELAASVAVNDYAVKVNAASAQVVLDAMTEAGFLKEKIQFADLLYETAR